MRAERRTKPPCKKSPAMKPPVLCHQSDAMTASPAAPNATRYPPHFGWTSTLRGHVRERCRPRSPAGRPQPGTRAKSSTTPARRDPPSAQDRGWSCGGRARRASVHYLHGAEPQRGGSAPRVLHPPRALLLSMVDARCIIDDAHGFIARMFARIGTERRTCPNIAAGAAPQIWQRVGLGVCTGSGVENAYPLQ
jgi:hypothetical protein